MAELEKVRRYRQSEKGQEAFRRARQRYAQSEKGRAYKQEYGRRNRLRNRLRKYGLTLEWYEQRQAEQGGACAICRRVPDEYLVIDHCHTTSGSRELLCLNCNAGLGQFKDDPALLLAAVAYLGKHGAVL